MHYLLISGITMRYSSLYKTSTRKLLPLRLSVLVIMMFLSCAASGRNDIAALNSKLKQAGNDSEKLKAYVEIYTHYEYSNSDSVIFYMNQGLSVFTGHNYKPGVAEMLSRLGGIYASKSMLEIAEKTNEEALKIFTELNDKYGIANANNVLGVVQGRKGDFAGAANHFFIALKIYEGLNDTVGITDDYIKLGKANEINNNFDKALEYYYRGLKLLNGKPVNDVVIFINNNIGAVFIGKKDYLSAMKYLQKALEESKAPAYAQIRILPLINIGDVYAEMGDKKKAALYYRQALEIAEQEHLPENYARILMNIANLDLRSKPENAIALLKEGLQTAKDIGDKQLQADILKHLIEFYKEKGNYKEAFSVLEQQKLILDSVLSLEKARVIANLEALHDLDKLSSKFLKLELSEQKQLQKKNTIITIAALLLVLLIIVVFFLWKLNQINTHLSKSEQQLKKASSVKNKLISIIAHDLIGSIGFMPLALGLCKDDSIVPEERNKLLGQLELNAISSFETLQNMLDWGKEQIQGVSLNQKYIDIHDVASEVLHFVHIAAANKLITIEDNIDPGITVFADPNHFKFIFRNLLSNAIKFTHKNGFIQINARKSEDESTMVFSVRDNGVGIKSDKKPDIFESAGGSDIGTDNEKGNGIGLKLCKEFVTENGGEIWMESEKGKGTTFYFSLKTNA